MTRIDVLDSKLPVPLELNDQQERKYLLGVASASGATAYYYIDSYSFAGEGKQERMAGIIDGEVVLEFPAELPWKIISPKLFKLMTKREAMELQCQVAEAASDIETKIHGDAKAIKDLLHGGGDDRGDRGYR